MNDRSERPRSGHLALDDTDADAVDGLRLVDAVLETVRDTDRDGPTIRVDAGAEKPIRHAVLLGDARSDVLSVIERLAHGTRLSVAGRQVIGVARTPMTCVVAVVSQDRLVAEPAAARKHAAHLLGERL